MEIQFGKKPLFVFEMANNHFGNVDLGLKIVRMIHETTMRFRDRFDFAFKLQYRELDTFIHPDFKSRDDVKYVKRFRETRLTSDQFLTLKSEISRQGFISMCTPFDEKSVDLIEEHGYDIIKVASCSLTDWPLLERIGKSERPIICSTAGVSLDDIDNVVSFLGHRNRQFALMHCVAEYPTSDEHLQMNQVDLLKKRYPNAIIGYSTHENPDNYVPVRLAVAKGALIFEKHVGVSEGNLKLNDYSASPGQVERWLDAATEAFEMCGAADSRAPFLKNEIESLLSLRRGVFARQKIFKGHGIGMQDIFLAIPTTHGQLTANDLSKYTLLTAVRDIEAKQPILSQDVERVETREKVRLILDKIKAVLRDSKAVVPQQLNIEISHHYGIDRFAETGCTIINYLNREYCKKLIVILPGQNHPEQYHDRKEETFIVLYGDVRIVLNGISRDCQPGDIVTVERGVKHIFSSKSGAVIEEISSTHYKDDSFYTDPAVSKNPNRKTVLSYWLD